MFIFVIAGGCFIWLSVKIMLGFVWMCAFLRLGHGRKKFSIKFGVDLTFCGVLFAVRC